MTPVETIAAALAAVESGADLEPTREALAVWRRDEADAAATRLRIWAACGHDMTEAAGYTFRHPLAVAEALRVEVTS